MSTVDGAYRLEAMGEHLDYDKSVLPIQIMNDTEI